MSCPILIEESISNALKETVILQYEGVNRLDSTHDAENFKYLRERKKKERLVFMKLGVITSIFVLMISPVAISASYEIITGTEAPDILAGVMCLGYRLIAYLTRFYGTYLILESRAESIFYLASSP